MVKGWQNTPIEVFFRRFLGRIYFFRVTLSSLLRIVERGLFLWDVMKQ
jgi:hypothetical protein